MRAAASATGVSGSAVTGARRTRVPTGASLPSGASAAASVAEAMRRRMLPITNVSPARVSSTGSAVAAGIR